MSKDKGTKKKALLPPHTTKTKKYRTVLKRDKLTGASINAI
jgi:hypothetical protein